MDYFPYQNCIIFIVYKFKEYNNYLGNKSRKSELNVTIQPHKVNLV